MDEIQKEVEKLKEHMTIIEEDINHYEVILLLLQYSNLCILYNVIIGKMVEVETGHN